MIKIRKNKFFKLLLLLLLLLSVFSSCDKNEEQKTTAPVDETVSSEIKDETETAKRKKDEEKINFRIKKSELESRINAIISNIQNIQNKLKNLKEEKKNLENEVTAMEANSNTVVSSLEMILLAVDNIYEKCAKKSAWTQHGDLKEFGQYDKNDKDKKKLYQKRVQEAKTKIKYINSYLLDYQTITEEYKKAKRNQEK